MFTQNKRKRGHYVPRPRNFSIINTSTDAFIIIIRFYVLRYVYLITLYLPTYSASLLPLYFINTYVWADVVVISWYISFQLKINIWNFSRRRSTNSALSLPNKIWTKCSFDILNDSPEGEQLVLSWECVGLNPWGVFYLWLWLPSYINLGMINSNISCSRWRITLW